MRPLYEVQEPSYYAVLDVDADASPSAIVKAYRLMALKYHPDRNPSAAPEHFQAISDAYNVLSDPEKRRLYDHYGPSLKPRLGESFAKLAPLLLALTTGFWGSTAYTMGWVGSFPTVAGIELGVLGVASLYYCVPRPSDRLQLPRREAGSGGGRREVVDVADYLAVSATGLVAGNVSGWLGASAVLLLRSLLHRLRGQ